MSNPWTKIDLKAYETHMSLNNVFQLQTLNIITKAQINDYDNTNIAILGVASGNGLENIDSTSTKKVYGIDINTNYLDICSERYPQLNHILELVCCDLSNVNTVLPFSNILICNLIIEYLGVYKFTELIKNNRKNVNIVSCVIQKNNNSNFVSSSSQTSALDSLTSIHKDIEADKLLNGLLEIGFRCIKNQIYPLPNGKEFIRMDFKE